MREIEESLAGTGINVRFVAIGDAQTVEQFCSRFGVTGRCLPDPDKRTYRAMGLEQYNFLRLFTDAPLRKRRQENKAGGFSQNWKATRLENAAQLPGAAFFDSGGFVRWFHRGTHPGDLPPFSEMLRAAAAANSAAR